MMRRRNLLAILVLVVAGLALVAAQRSQPEASATVTVYKSPT
jgi:hypothetical protein